MAVELERGALDAANGETRLSGKTRWTTLLVAIGAASLASTPQPANAGQRADDLTRTVMVKVDRQPASDTAAQRLLRRLDVAAAEACGVSSSSLVEVRRAVRRSDCWHRAMATAVDQIGHPRLAAAFQNYRPL